MGANDLRNGGGHAFVDCPDALAKSDGGAQTKLFVTSHPIKHAYLDAHPTDRNL